MQPTTSRIERDMKEIEKKRAKYSGLLPQNDHMKVGAKKLGPKEPRQRRNKAIGLKKVANPNSKLFLYKLSPQPTTESTLKVVVRVCN